jgi:hypothetical protein
MAIQIAINHPETEKMTKAIGSLIVNFGYIEYEMYLWLACLQDSLVGLEDAGLFGNRVRRLLDDLSAIDHALREQATNRWNKARDIAIFRNRIAHNPIMFGWSGTDQVGPPDFLAVIDTKIGLSTTGADPRVTLQEINDFVDGDAALGQELRELRSQIWNA